MKKQPSPAPSRPKKKTGRPAGSRHNVETTNQSPTGKAVKKDPRLGSKKPIPLLLEPKVSASEKTKKTKGFFSPQQELKALEQDTRLNKLLDKAEQNKRLTEEEQQYLNTKLARHQQLCTLLGIDQEGDGSEGEGAQKSAQEQTSKNEMDLLAQFEAIDPSQVGKH